ncbi:hypothetical protein CRV08_09080 [Halarcobacter ebronensis]|uniref:Uncharacterized protein n=1 Tax=Halarcobacter ebronensis TaxID=1462615 RepID=A0A4Q1AUA9_9BACT|nr:hypothetical protein [Halarcobacter ebronensis]QKF80836.1 hypothetical protein AEBR_0320 [Halarcobacter ebronensis]RXJ67952.1 hypothetical protein CRV08_09080 [Halarcobacter ebronensis]RXK08626.1 hypothetical protein CRV07_02140 [Halarcobacter ebronensis]
MAIDLLIPFIILIVLVVYLIYTRNKFEKNILDMYDKKFEEWKTNSTSNRVEKPCKELVGLIYKDGYNINIELLDGSVSSSIQQGKFKIKDK